MRTKLGMLMLLFVLTISHQVGAQQERVRLIAEQATVTGAAWSPDGQKIALAVIGKLPNQASSGVYIVTADGKELARVTENITPGDFIGFDSWSPDGKYMKFSAGPAGGPSQVIIASAEGKVLSRGQREPSESIFSPWLPNSKAYLRLVEQSSSLVAIEPDGKEAQRSSEVLNPGVRPELSPDGKFVAAATDSGVVLIESTTLKTLAEASNGESIDSLIWSPNSRLLLAIVVSNSAQVHGLILDPTGKQISNLGMAPSLKEIQWSTDSSMLASINKPGKNGKADVTFLGLDSKVMGSASMGSESGEWTPDSTYMILTPEGSLITVFPDGTTAHDFGFKADRLGSAYALPITSWSPNGKLMAVVPNPSGSCCRKALLIYSAEGKLLRELERGSDDLSGGLYWSKDSTALVLAEGANGAWLVKVQ